MPTEALSRQWKKSALIVGIMVSIALLHIVTGPHYQGPFPDFVNGYLIDILLPMGLYLLLTPQDAKVPFMRPWIVKAVPVFLIGVVVETLQYLDVPIFGRTFDPFDYGAYALGVCLGWSWTGSCFPGYFPSGKWMKFPLSIDSRAFYRYCQTQYMSERCVLEQQPF